MDRRRKAGYIYPKVFEDVKAKENASTIIKKLKEKGNTIYIITTRTKIKESYKVTQQMLDKYNFVLIIILIL